MSIIAGVVLALALPASGAATVQDKDPNKIVCKSEPGTGSRIRRGRTCRTRAEWDELQREKDRRSDSNGSPFRDEGVETLPRRAG
jgi:hypothetical protein